MLAYQLEHIFSYHVTVTLPELVGPVPEGLRLNFYITGGEITGPKLTGKVRASGADWLNVRRDGVGVVDVRGVLDTHDGALIYITFDGTADFGEDGYERAVALQPPAGPTRVRTFPRFHTAHPKYLWLNRLPCLGIGEIQFDRFRVDYDIYAVR